MPISYDVAVYVKGGKNLNFGKPDDEVIEEYRKNGNVPAGRLGATSTKRAEFERGLNGGEDGGGKERGASSHYRGVSWYAARQIWKASIQVNRKKEYIGRFETEEEAARAYNKRATELRGSEAVLNIVPNTVTRYPSAEMLANVMQLEEGTKRPSKKRCSSDSDSSDHHLDINASSIPPSNEVNRKKSKKSRQDDLLNFQVPQPTSSYIPPTPTIPNIAQTPHMTRIPIADTDTVTRGMQFDAAEFDEAIGSGSFFPLGSMTPGFLSPPTQTLRKRANLDTFPLSVTSASKSLGGFGGNMTPMLQNLFDSPAENDMPGSFTPSDRSITRSHRKTLLPQTYSLNT